jgi:predicted RNA methylase
MESNKKKTGLKRDTTDKFYTCKTAVKECMHQVSHYLNIDLDSDLVIEPSAGNGSFINEIKQLCRNALFYDIKPEQATTDTIYDIITQDYLILDLATVAQPFSKVHVIGNPPFGRQSTLAIQFIKKSAEFADSISFILPKSFKKDSMQKYFPNQFHLVYQMDLDDNSFLQDGKPTSVPCVFQIWEKRSVEREPIVKLEANPNVYQFVKIDETPDISFRRVGVYAGTITVASEENNWLQDKSVQSHYFIKFCLNNETQKGELIKKISKIKYAEDNTVGPKSIGKQEIMREINKLL